MLFHILNVIDLKHILNAHERGHTMNTDNIEKLPKTIKTELFITLAVSGWNTGKIGVWDCDVSEGGSEEYILLTTKTVTFKLPQNMDIKGKVIEGLEAEKDRIQADTHMKLKDIQEKIDNLLAIEYKP